jgi:patatin-like phospholipase/acyl hydrolase
MASPMEDDALQSHDNVQTFENTGYCLLSLDGGGVRGLSTLYILQNIMNRLNYMREEAGLEHKKPYQIFDLIGGTSTGGYVYSIPNKLVFVCMRT